jgi:tungstate transport system ATP-binding protein
MTMHAPASDLPLTFEQAGIVTRGVTILDRVTLSIAAGPPTVLVGPNGSGKTTILRAAMGLVSLSSGRMTWGSRETVAHPRRAIVSQRPIMLRRTAAANVRYALAAAHLPRTTHHDRAAELLRLVGLEQMAHRPARRLSGGEQQRLALARALARDPSVLFLDEPTASLDPYATKAIEDIIHTVSARGVKVVIATHDLGQAKRLGGNIVLLHRGRLVENAPATEFFAKPRTEEARKFVAGELLV